ncbi:MAG: hypothetical protein K0R51_3274 [Cytophagaceae bacterium]|jgi:hypothetical protein|nr:hypothetical protein [Cytophagaceae bacterium]
MKKSILLFAFSLVALTSYSSSEIIASPVTVVSVNGEDKKVEIEVAKLPASVAASINETHKGASISKAYQHENAEGKVTGYEVIVKSGDKEETLKFDAAGALVK